MVLEILPKLRDAAAFAVDAAAFAVHLLEMMLLDPELQFANQSHLWFARHLALWIQEGRPRAQRGSVR